MSPYTPSADDSGLPAGQHVVTIIDIKERTARTGTDQWLLEMYDDQNRYIEDYLALTPKAEWRLRQVWDAAGLDWPDDGIAIDERDLLNQHVQITVAPDEWQGVTRLKVKEYGRPVGSDIPTGPPRTDLPPATAPAPGQPSQAVFPGVGGGSAQSDDDLPF